MIELGNPNFELTKEVLDDVLKSNDEIIYQVESQIFTTPYGYHGKIWRPGIRARWEEKGLKVIAHR